MRSVVLALALVVAAASCLAKDPVTEPGTGGSANGGTTSKGGTTSAGGSKSTGGVTSAGGKTGSGGATSNGGSTQPTSVDCPDTSSSTNFIQNQYGGTFITVDNVSGKNYYMMANWWGMSPYNNAAETVNGLGFTMTNPNGMVTSNNNPLGFPSIFIGGYAGHNTTGSNLPKQVSALTSIPTVFSTNSDSKGTKDYNAAYDVWFTQSGSVLGSGSSSPGTGGAYLMVWYFKPSNRQPRGSIVASGRFVDGVAGTWDVWYDTTNPPCVSYVSNTVIASLEFDLNNFITDAVKNKYGVTTSQYLSLIFAGFEVWGGGDGLQVKRFCANVK